MVSAHARRSQVAYAQRRGVSVRKACALLSVARSTLGYESRLVKRDAPVVVAMRELAAQYPRYGYRRIQVFLARRGHVMSADRTHRLWRLHGLQVPRKRPRRRVASARPRPLQPTGPGQVWAYDFVFDASVHGARGRTAPTRSTASSETSAKILIEDFRRGFNQVRPHSSLGQLTPAEFKLKLSQQNPMAAILK